jgi:2-hydroxycyclohexanecarboxyl-CoA dehydrogenase
MVEAGWGRIVTISSSSAQRGAPRMVHYAASKGGVIAMTKALAREFAPFGITVNDIPPSSIETPMQHRSQAEGDLPANEIMAKGIPLGRLGTPEEVAAACAFLCSEEASFITGQVLGVNGGSHI